MAAYSSIRVLPVAYGEKNGEVGSYCDENDADKCTGQAIKSYVGIEIKDVGSIKHLLKSETLSMSQGSNSKADNCCDSIEQGLQESPTLDEEVRDQRQASRLKMCNLMRSMQQTNIAELFPIMESRETTESSEEQVICRICHTGGDELLIAPCRCIGSAQFVHATCILTWFKKSVKNQCELCQHQVPIKKKRKPLTEWKKPEDKPIPLIWFLVFFVGLGLNILSIHVNASEGCKSTACLIFYVVNGFGIVLDAAFLWFWWMKCLLYWRKWCAINQDWSITDSKRNHDTMVTYERKNKSLECLNQGVEGFEFGDNIPAAVMV